MPQHPFEDVKNHVSFGDVEKRFAGNRYEYVVSLDLAWIYLNYVNGSRLICYLKWGDNRIEYWVMESPSLLFDCPPI